MEEIEVLQPKNTDGNPTKGKKNRKPLVISIVFIFILLGIAGGLYYLYTGQQGERGGCLSGGHEPPAGKVCGKIRRKTMKTQLT